MEKICSSETTEYLRTQKTVLTVISFIHYFKQLAQTAHHNSTAESKTNTAVFMPIHISEANEALRHLLKISKTSFNFLRPETCNTES
jgi:hypothetical protein